MIHKIIHILGLNGFFLILLAVYLILLGLDVPFAYNIVLRNKDKMRDKRDLLLIAGIFCLFIMSFTVYKAIKSGQ